MATPRTATAPPVASLPMFPPNSTRTATTIFGCWAGAKQTNQAWGFPLGFWAVPVLPATVTPGICAAVPVPDWTTPIIICVISEAVRGEMGLPSS